MVTPIDAVRSGMGFDEAGHWHRARLAWAAADRAQRDEDDPAAPVRGIFYGLVISAALWAGIFAGVKALFTHF
jgi:hypothetical protein